MNFQISDILAGNKILLFDNNHAEVKVQERYARSLGMIVIFVEDLEVFWTELKGLPKDSIVFVDQHMETLNDFSEIGFREISTMQGANVGVAVVRGLMPKIDTQLKVHVMSGYVLGDIAKKEIGTAISRGHSSRFVDKTDIIDFQKAIKEHAIELRDKSIITTKSIINEIDWDDYHIRVGAAKKMVVEWSQGNHHEAISCFGYVADNLSEIDELAEWLPSHYSLDVSLRADAIIQIKKALLTIYPANTDLSLESDWLQTPDEHLNEKSPWELMVSGKMSDLVRVAGLVSRIL